MIPDLLQDKPSPTAVQKALAWAKKKATADKHKLTENEARAPLVAALFKGDTSTFVGGKTIHFEKAEERVLSLAFSFKQNKTVNPQELDIVYQSLIEYCAKKNPGLTPDECQAAASELYLSVFSFKPSLVEAKYKALPDSVKVILDRAIVSKPAAIGVAIK
jgi:hypothetical protein